MNKIKLLPLLLLIFSCASNIESEQQLTKFRDSAINLATNNQPESLPTAEEEIFIQHQRANAQWIDLNGNVVKSYSYSQRKLGPLSYVPLLSFFLPRNYQNYEVIITMRDTAIVDVKASSSLITLESESMCNEAIFSCIKKAE